MSQRVSILLSFLLLINVITGCSKRTYLGKVIQEHSIEATNCKLEIVNRIADSLIYNYRNEVPFTNDLAIQFQGTDSCQCHYIGMVDISLTEKKIIFRCDSISRVREGNKEYYGESYLVKYNRDSIISIGKGVVMFPEEHKIK